MNKLYVADNKDTIITFLGMNKLLSDADVDELWRMAGGWKCPHDNIEEVSNRAFCIDCGTDLGECEWAVG